MAGIDQEISMRMNAANNNPQLLMQRYAQQGQNVLDLLSAQLLSNQNKAAENSVNAMFQDTPPVINQLEQENAQSAQREVVNALRPGLEMQGQQMANQGIASNPVNNMRMADGGIVGFAGEGPSLVKEKPTMGSVPQNAVSPDQIKIDAGTYESLTTAIANASTPEIKARNQMLLQDLINKMTDENTHALVMQYIDSTKGVVQPRAQGMAGGGIVALKEGGGIISRILDFFRRDKVQPLTEEEVLETMSQYGLDSGYADPRLRDRGRGINRGIMTLRNIEPEETIEETMETMTVPTRAEQFGQRFPGARRAINEAGGSREGGMKYLKMIGEMQAEAEEDEARRALNYIKMMAGSQDMIDDVDPAVNIPTFAGPEGSLVGADDDTGRRRAESIMEAIGYTLPTDEERARFDEYGVNPYSGRDAVASVLSGLTGWIGSEGRQRMAQDQRRAELKEQYPDLSTNQVDNLLRVEIGKEIATRANGTDVVEEVTEEEVIKGGPVPTRTLSPTPLDKLKSVTMGQATGGFRAPEEVEEEGGIDIRRLQAFLAGGAGQASTAGALGGGLRGLMAEDQRAEKMDLTERDVMGRIGASRYGAELDYEAAVANLQQRDREMIFDAQASMLEEEFKADASAVREAMGRLEENETYQLAFMRLAQQYSDQPALLGAELAAVANDIASKDVNIQRALLGGGGGGTFGYTAPPE